MRNGTYLLILSLAMWVCSSSSSWAQSTAQNATQNVLNQSAANPICPPGYQGNDYQVAQTTNYEDPSNFCFAGEDIADCYRRTLSSGN
ncbi:MAG: hypothetical protein R3A11_05545 [Bdellovibrionota bacterium]